ncbi:MAG TPA: ScbR family autoregulator-binding transcription factor [Streptomyces sp.]|nr:ScbR family autoregulator-binding transcription factor [Streptomyces sp.]
MTKQQRAIRTRGELIRAAATLFEQCGFAQTTLGDISRHIGVSSGALHFHFENKAALASAIEAEASSVLHCLARRARARQTDALQELVDASHALAADLRDNVVIRAGFRLSGDASRQGGLRLLEQWQAYVRQLLADAEAEKSLAPDVPLRDAVSVVVAATTGLGALSRGDLGWLSRRSVTGLWSVLLPRLVDAAVLDRLDPAGVGVVCSPMSAALAPSGLAN